VTQKTNGGKPTGRTSAPAKTNKDKKAAPVRPARPSNVDRYTVKPEFWDRVLDSIPPWGDEIAAIMLIVFGVVSFLSLLNVSSDNTISAAWSRAITSMFGWGSVIVSGAIFVLGIIVMLRKLGVVVHFPTRRILALELAFLSSLALLHLISGDNELRALARAGQGGGLVGWGLSALVSGLFGTIVAEIVYGVLLLLSISTVIGLRSAAIRDWMRRTGDRLERFGRTNLSAAQKAQALRRAVQVDVKPDTLAGATEVLAEAPRTPPSPIVRIRHNPANLPPSMRPGAAPLAETPAEPASKVPDHPLFNRQEPLPDYNAIGTPKGKRSKDGFLLVERPDGRIKRYFTVDNLKEPKYVSKRGNELPSLDMLHDVELNLPDEMEINNNVVLIENTLLEFDIDVDVVDVKVGPTVTQYAVQPFRETTDESGESVVNRTRVSKIASLSSDLALALSAKRLRVEAPVPGHSYIGIEVPNRNPSVVALRSVYESKAFWDEVGKKKSPLIVPLGRDVSGAPFIVDLASMPHLLIAGTTGSGKSVAIAALATALILHNSPETVRLVMLDPKMVELSRFNGIPHLIGPVETDLERIIGVLRWCTREMDRRYKLLEEHAARNIDTFNSRLGRRRKDEYLPYMVIMIDEIGDLMLSRPDETEKTITRLAQMARAVGMHLIVATQRPSVDVITGLIKANFPSRISFAVASSTDSRVILDTVGAESLMGKGDMLFHASDAAAPRRVQGCFVSDDEVRAVVDYWRDWHQLQVEVGTTEDVGIGPWERGLTRREFLSETDPMLEQAIALVVEAGEASASLIQRRLGLGYPRAARIMDLLEQLGIVGEVKAGGRSREVRIKPGEDPFKDMIDKRMKGP
jgi:S-DNA-T family DNA segregation ATPase FtsK/SpoIIIE